MPELKERNDEIRMLAIYQGMSRREIASKYGLSISRTNQIIDLPRAYKRRKYHLADMFPDTPPHFYYIERFGPNV